MEEKKSFDHREHKGSFLRPAETTRVLYSFNHSNRNEHHVNFCNNYVTTSKYNLFTFFPKGLFEQYRRSANLYFTLVAVLSFFSFSPVSPFTTITPLVFVLGIALTKEGIEDWKRHLADHTINYSKVKFWTVGVNTQSDCPEKMCQNVEVGDIVIVEKNQQLPADIFIINSSNPDGMCYVETMNLDGETNLKLKKALDSTVDINLKTVSQFKGRLECDLPNSSLYTFKGNLSQGDQDPIPVTPVQVLLRGSCLRNTEWVLGLVVYTGHDTKVFMNSTDAPSKRSQVERRLDLVIYFMFAMLVMMCLVDSISVALWTETDGPNMWYLMLRIHPIDEFDPEDPPVVFVFSFLNGIILYGYLIPISLYISVEIAKVAQALYFINNDSEMYHKESDTWAVARTSNLNEELGMVQIILTDKTGTLTRNTMEFFRCSIAGVSYGKGVTEVEIAQAQRLGHAPPEEDQELIPAGGFEKGFNMRDERLLGGNWVKEKERDTIQMFFRLLAVCHTIVPEGDYPELTYQAESPDELAFAVAAKALGFFFHKRTVSHVHVEQMHAMQEDKQNLPYEVLAILEFNSIRKRMSVICRGPDKRVVLFCKGADSVIYERLSVMSNPHRESTQAHLTSFAEAGLRTLCLAYCYLDETVFSAWMERYYQAKTSMRDSDRLVEEAAEAIEKDLVLLGATGIEDKLQIGVPQALSLLANGKIAIWMLTGDKIETAINIGYSCSLLRTESTLHVVAVDECPTPKESQADAILAQLNKAIEEIQENERVGVVTHNALIIDGRALSLALLKPQRAVFLALGLRCQSVICCRVSPLQKAQVTCMAKDSGIVTLAIGDGANDVGMIQAAHIGVGISGQEGMQATMASDYSIGQFRFLVRLVLIHGRWNLRRIVRVIFYFFYKNVVFGMSLLFYNAMCFFSGQMIYSDLFSSSYNVLFTFIPVIAIGVFDQDISSTTALANPQIYSSSGTFFSWRRMAWWFFLGLYQSVVLTFFVLLTYMQGGAVVTGSEEGKVTDMYAVGMAMYTCIVLTVNLELVVVLTYWNWFTLASVVLSILGWFLFISVFGSMPVSYSGSLHHLFEENLAQQPSFWLLCLLTVVASVLPDLLQRMLQRVYFPSDIQILHEMEALLPKKSLRPSDIESARNSTQLSCISETQSYHKSVLRTKEEDPANLLFHNEPDGIETHGYWAKREAEEAGGTLAGEEEVRSFVLAAADSELLAKFRTTVNKSVALTRVSNALGNLLDVRDLVSEFFVEKDTVKSLSTSNSPAKKSHLEVQTSSKSLIWRPRQAWAP